MEQPSSALFASDFHGGEDGVRTSESDSFFSFQLMSDALTGEEGAVHGDAPPSLFPFDLSMASPAPSAPGPRAYAPGPAPGYAPTSQTQQLSTGPLQFPLGFSRGGGSDGREGRGDGTGAGGAVGGGRGGANAGGLSHGGVVGVASSGHGPPVAHGGHPLPGMAVVPGGPVPLTPGPPSYGMAFEGQLDAVRSKMLPYLRYFSVSLSPANIPRYLRRALEVEGCPFCLHTEVTGSKPLVSITCVDEGCHHACHLDCVGAPMWYHRLTNAHPPLRGCATPTRSPRLTVLPKPAPPAARSLSPSPAPPAARFAIEVTLLHLLSTARLVSFTADDAVSMRDPGSDLIIVHMLADTGDEATPLDDSDHLPRMSCSPVPGAPPTDGPKRFSISRGRLAVTIREKGTDKVWELFEFFDLKGRGTPGPGQPQLPGGDGEAGEGDGFLPASSDVTGA
jgi:hypothetical protein